MLREPFFIAQTFELEHTKDRSAAQTWFNSCYAEAHAKGGRFPRFSIRDDGRGLLFECWSEYTPNQGNPRWMFTLAGVTSAELEALPAEELKARLISTAEKINIMFEAEVQAYLAE